MEEQQPAHMLGTSVLNIHMQCLFSVVDKLCVWIGAHIRTRALILYFVNSN